MQVKFKLTERQRLDILTKSRHLFIYSEISEKELTANFGITPRDLRSIYQQYVCDTPKAYITKVKMCKARTLLANTNQSIIDIALLLGYENPSHMSAKFKELYSITPSAYRRLSFLSSVKAS